MNYKQRPTEEIFLFYFYIPGKKMTYSTILETKTELENFYLSSIAFPPNPSLFPQSKAK